VTFYSPLEVPMALSRLVFELFLRRFTVARRTRSQLISDQNIISSSKLEQCIELEEGYIEKIIKTKNFISFLVCLKITF